VTRHPPGSLFEHCDVTPHPEPVKERDNVTRMWALVQDAVKLCAADVGLAEA